MARMRRRPGSRIILSTCTDKTFENVAAAHRQHILDLQAVRRGRRTRVEEHKPSDEIGQQGDRPLHASKKRKLPGKKGRSIGGVRAGLIKPNRGIASTDDKGWIDADSEASRGIPPKPRVIGGEDQVEAKAMQGRKQALAARWAAKKVR